MLTRPRNIAAPAPNFEMYWSAATIEFVEHNCRRLSLYCALSPSLGLPSADEQVMPTRQSGQCTHESLAREGHSSRDVVRLSQPPRVRAHLLRILTTCELKIRGSERGGRDGFKGPPVSRACIIIARHYLFREEASTRSARIFGPAVEHQGTCQTKHFFERGAFSEQGPQLSNKSRSAPRSGKAATLPTLQMESRHAASARLTGFRHRWTARQAQQVRPFM